MKTGREMSKVFAALADPTRLALLALLAKGELTVLELAKPFDISQPGISRHLKVLEDAGLIQRRIDGTRRPCSIRAEAVAELDEWLNAFRASMENNYARLDQVLATMKEPTDE